MLTWALVSKRPLTVMELRDAIAIRPGQRRYERECLVNQVDRMISWCCNLLMVDEEDSFVRFPHYSVKEFLLGTCQSQGPSTEMFRFSEFEVDIRLCHLCCTYLQFSDFERQMIRTLPGMPDITPKDLVNTALTSDNKSLTAQAWLKLSRIRSNKRQEATGLAFLGLQNLAMKVAGSPNPLDTQFPLLAYASEYWSWHGSRLTMGFPSEWCSFEKLVFSTNDSIKRPFPDIDWQSPSDLELETIARRDHSALMQISLRELGASCLQNPAPLHRLLTLAIEHTSFEVLRTITITGEPTGRSALSYIESRFEPEFEPVEEILEPVEVFELAMTSGQVCATLKTSYIAMLSTFKRIKTPTIFFLP